MESSDNYDLQSRPRVELPQGTQPLLRRPVRASSNDVFVGEIPEDSYRAHRHPGQWQVLAPMGAWFEVRHVTMARRTKTESIKPGQIWFLPPNVKHSEWVREPGEIIAIFADAEKVKKYFPSLRLVSAVHVLDDYVAVLPAISRLFRDLRQFAMLPNGATDWKAANIGAHLSTLLFEAHIVVLKGGARIKNRLTIGVVEAVKAHLEKRMTDRVPVEAMARALKISSRHFRRLFHDAMGTSPERWLMTNKAAYAKGLLIEGKSIAEAAEQAGFCDESHLHRVIKEHLSISPGKLRKLGGEPSPDHP